MTERQEAEIGLLRARHPNATVAESGGVWLLVPGLQVSGEWNHRQYDVCFQLNPGYPDTKPYAFYARPLPRYANDHVPESYQDNGDPKPPFPGEWGKFSWDAPDWKSAPDINTGSNLLNWVESFRGRFSQGK